METNDVAVRNGVLVQVKRRGRRRNADQILMAIKALTLEFDRRRYEWTQTDVVEFVCKIKRAFDWGNKEVAKYWEEKIIEIERELRK